MILFPSSDSAQKDGNETGRGNNGARLIKAYYIHSIEHLEEKKQK